LPAAARRAKATVTRPFEVKPPDSSTPGRCAIHQDGIVDTPTGEWWGFSMMDANAVGRLTALSPVTWTDGWPYFGPSGNLGRSPRTWVKPNTGATEVPRAPYQRSDDFSADRLQPIWQWNHVPLTGGGRSTSGPGSFGCTQLPAFDLWRARNTLTQRAIGPRSTVTVTMDASGLKPGDVVGLALFNRPYGWIGVERGDEGMTVSQFDEVTGTSGRAPLPSTRVWLRADCDYVKTTASFRYSTDGTTYTAIGEAHVMAYGLITFQGVRNSLFAYGTRSDAEGGYADFDAIEVTEGRGRPFRTASGSSSPRQAARRPSRSAGPGRSR
jgi:beta-xylosidase